jgi:hypothetical protein
LLTDLGFKTLQRWLKSDFNSEDGDSMSHGKFIPTCDTTNLSQSTRPEYGLLSLFLVVVVAAAAVTGVGVIIIIFSLNRRAEETSPKS